MLHAGSIVAYGCPRTSRTAHATLCGCSWPRIVLPKYSPCPLLRGRLFVVQVLSQILYSCTHTKSHGSELPSKKGELSDLI
jgi:hypothetical protein